mmetsp:Transcript_25931/g.24774  ORF Transcript_25931/g.24774 Transcript_25931/m.24774 type:complete len:193 (-) Transcript_25931:2656-3234(-)
MVASSSSSALDKKSFLDNSFAFYASYHKNHANKIIHIFCVWPIFFTFLIFLCYTDPYTILKVGSFNLPLDWALIVSSVYFSYYAVIEQPGIAGTISSGLVLMSYAGAKNLTSLFPSIWKASLGLHIFCWVAQFYGHGVHEGRSPALLDNLFQALIMAPLFIVMELLFMVGYKKEFQERMHKALEVKPTKKTT